MNPYENLYNALEKNAVKWPQDSLWRVIDKLKEFDKQKVIANAAKIKREKDPLWQVIKNSSPKKIKAIHKSLKNK